MAKSWEEIESERLKTPTKGWLSTEVERGADIKSGSPSSNYTPQYLQERADIDARAKQATSQALAKETASKLAAAKKAAIIKNSPSQVKASSQIQPTDYRTVNYSKAFSENMPVTAKKELDSTQKFKGSVGALGYKTDQLTSSELAKMVKTFEKDPLKGVREFQAMLPEIEKRKTSKQGFLARNIQAGANQFKSGMMDLTSNVAEALGFKSKSPGFNAERQATRSQMNTASEVNAAKGPVTKFAGDVVQGVTQAVPGIAMATLSGPAAGMATFGAPAAGSYMGEAEAEGAPIGKRLVYGAVGGVLEAGLERALGIFNISDAVIKQPLKALFKENLKTVAKEFGKNAAGEGVEEVITNLGMTAAKKVLYDADAQFDIKGALYEGAVGAVAGGVMQAPSMVGNVQNAKLAADKIQNEYPETLLAAIALPKNTPAHTIADKMIKTQHNITLEELENLKIIVQNDLNAFKDTVSTKDDSQFKATTEKRLGTKQADLSAQNVLALQSEEQQAKKPVLNRGVQLQKQQQPVVETAPTKQQSTISTELSTKAPKFTATVYQGRGKSAEEIYKHTKYPVAGEGQYYALNEETAKKYGDKVSKTEVTLNNPLVIKDDADFKELTKAAGWKYSILEAGDPTNIDKLKALKQTAKNMGHDGLVVNFEADQRGDINYKTGGAVKTLRNMFGHDQVVSYAKQEVRKQKAPRKPRKSIKKVIAPETMDTRYIDSKQNKDGKQNLYSEDFPEVKPYQVKRAKELLTDLDETVKGERIPLDAEATEWVGIPRTTSPTMARIKDSTGATYEEIGTALNNLISGKNTALTRRIEVIIDENMLDGYTTFEGEKVPMNNAYVQIRNKIEPNKVDIPDFRLAEKSTTGESQITMGLPGENVSLFDSDQQKGVEKGEPSTKATKTVESVSKVEPNKPISVPSKEVHKQAIKAAGLEGKADIVTPKKTIQKQAVTMMKSLGRDVVFYKPTADGSIPDGFVTGDGNTIYVNANQSSDNLIFHTIGHEFFHTIKTSPKYKPIFDDMISFAKENFDSKAKMKFLDTYSNVPELQAKLEANEEMLLEEMLADEMGNSFVEKDFWQKVYDYSSDLFDKVVKIIDGILAKISGAKYDTYISEEVAANLQTEFAAVVAMIRANEQIGEKNVETKSKPDSVAYSTRAKEIEKAFKGSKIRDEDGKLLKVYHGTDRSGITAFKAFAAEGWGKGIYFTDNIEAAKNYGTVMSAFLNITNPYKGETLSTKDMESTKTYKNLNDPEADADELFAQNGNFANGVLRDLGYDGVMTKDSNDIIGYEIVAFEPNQIKSPEGDFPVDMASDDIRYSVRSKEPKYPIAPQGEWWGDANYQSVGASLVEMTPDEFLKKSKPLKMDEDTKENVDDLKEHIKSGKTLDPLVLYSYDVSDVKASDGRHRAIAAKELGIKKVPVIDYTTAVQYSARSKELEEKNLVAIHNISEEKLKMAFQLGGFPVPSIAVTKEDIPFTNFGDITLVGKADIVDPQISKANKIYDTDIYSKRMPTLKAKVNQKELNKLVNRLNYSFNEVDDYIYSIEQIIKTGEIAQSIKDMSYKLGVRRQFLKENDVDIPVTRRFSLSMIDEQTARKFLSDNPSFNIDNFYENEDQYKKKFKTILMDYWTNIHDKQTAKDLFEGYADDGKLSLRDIENIKDDILKVKSGRASADIPTIRKATELEIEKREDAFKDWLLEVTQPIFGEKYYSAWVNGKEKKIPYDIDKVFSYMKGNVKASEGGMFTTGPKVAKARASKEYKSLSALRKDKELLTTEAETTAYYKEFEDRANEVASDLTEYSPYKFVFDQFYDAMGDYLTGTNSTKALEKNEFENVPSELVSSFEEVSKMLLNSPVNYFEAKPQRIVAFNDFAAALVGQNASSDIIAKLKREGLMIIPYDLDSQQSWLDALELTKTLDTRFSHRQRQLQPGYTEAKPSLKESKTEALASLASQPAPRATGLNLDVKGTKKASDVISSMTDEFNTALFNKQRGTPLGTYNNKTATIRMKKANDLQVFTHEAGHHLDKVYQISINATGVAKSQLLIIGERTSKKNYPMTRKMREGVAEYLRLYMTDKAATVETYPELTAYFESKVDERMMNLVNKWADDSWKLYNLSAPERVGKSIMFLDEKPSIKDVLFEKLKVLDPENITYMAHIAYEGVFDQTHMVEYFTGELAGKAAQETMNEQLAKFRGYEGIATSDIYYQQNNLNGKKIGESYRDITRLTHVDKKTRQDFVKYQVARRSIDYHYAGLEMPDTLETYQAAISELETLYPEFEGVFNKLFKYRTNQLEVLKEGGIYGQEQLDEIIKNNPNYVPLKRDVGADTKTGAGTGRKLAGGKKVLKKRTGGGQNIIDVEQSDISNTFIYRSAAMRNKILLDLADWSKKAEGMGYIMQKADPKFTVMSFTAEQLEKQLESMDVDTNGMDPETAMRVFKPNYLAGDNQIVVYRDGKAELYDVHPDLYQSLNGMSPELGGLIIQVMAAISTIQKAGIVMTPKFVTYNFSRDMIHSSVSTNANINPFTIMVGIGSSLFKTENYQKALKSGALSGFFVNDRDNIARTVDDIMTGENRAKQAMNFVKHPTEILRFFSDAIELGPKVAEFNTYMKHFGYDQKQIDAAVVSARNLSYDYKMMGRWVKKTQWNRIANFFNPQLQGLKNTIRLFETPQLAFRTTAKSIVYITIPTMMLMWLNRDNEYYKELPQWRRDFFWNLPVGDPKTAEVFIPIPKPFELGLIFGAVPERLVDDLYNNDKHAWDGIMDTIYKAIVPDFMPSALNPVYELKTNKNFLGSPILSQSDLGLYPEQQYSDYTPKVAKGIAKLTKGLPLPNELKSPKQIQHLIEGYTTTVGKNVMKGIDAALEGDVKGAVVATTGLGKSLLVESLKNPESVNRFYNNKTNIDKLYRSLSKQKKNVTPNVDALKKDFNDVYYDLNDLNDLKRALVAGKQVKGFENLSKEEVKTHVDGINKKIIEMTQRVNGLYDKYFTKESIRK